MSSHQNVSNMFSSQTASSRMNKEIKRLQQLQRLQVATAACSFPSVGATGSLLSTGSSNMNNSSNDFGVLGSGSSGLAMGSIMDPGNSSSNNVNNNPMLASFLAAHQQQQQQQQQQDETRMMLLQQQMRANSNSNNAGALNSGLGNALHFSNTGAGGGVNQAVASNLFTDTSGGSLSLLTPSTLFQQQQLLLQQRQQQQASVQMMRPLVRVGAIEPFPEKLHRMLMEVESCGRGDVISFINDGRGFAIHKPETFFKEIVPLYFRHSRLSSFKRQLNLYGFEQINIGPYRGGYYHETFHRDNPDACRRMRRVAVKVSGAMILKKKEQEAKARLEAEEAAKEEEKKKDPTGGEEASRKDKDESED